MISRYAELAGTITDSSGQVVEKWSEIHGPRFTCDERGLTGERSFKVYGTLLAPFVAAMKGSPHREDAPEAFPGFPTLLCVSATGEPLFKGVKGAKEDFTSADLSVPRDKKKMSFEWFKVDCRYEVPQTFSYDFASEQISLPGRGFMWPGETTPLPGDVPVGSLPAIELCMSRKGVPSLKVNFLASSIGKLNAGNFSPIEVDLDWRNRVGLGRVNPYTSDVMRDTLIPPKCAMLVGARAKPTLDPLGRIGWDIDYKFAVRPTYAPWDTFYHAAKALVGASAAESWDNLVVITSTDANGNQTGELFDPYPSINFGELFQ